MTTDLDPHIARRRRQVQEMSARRRLRWMILLLLLVFIGGLVVAVLRSSWFSISTIEIEGAVRADVPQILSGVGIKEGVSIVTVRAARVETALRADPWIAEAKVRVVWPRTIRVLVLEYEPVARVETGDGSRAVVSATGEVLADTDVGVDALVAIDVGPVAPGSQIGDPDALAAIEFIAALPVRLRSGGEVALGTRGLTAIIAGHVVELGDKADMAEKAATLVALLEKGLAPDATISVVSPLRPAVLNPQPVVEGHVEGTTERTTSG